MKNFKFELSLAILLVLMLVGTCFATGGIFTDIDNTSYEIPVYALLELDVMNGYSDSTFKPSNTVTRAEMIKMIVTAYRLENLAKNSDEKSTGYADVDMDYFISENMTTKHWASGYIYVAKEYDFIDENSKNFYPDAKITYADAITYCLRILGYKNEIESKGSAPDNYIQKAKNLKLLKGLEISDYSASATRGDIAVLLWNVMNAKMWENSSKTTDTFMEIKYPNKVADVEKLIKELTTILPTDISLSKSNTKICIGVNGVDTKLKCSVLAVPTVTPENATNKTVTWTSSNNAIVSIENGYIIAKQKGNVVLTAKTVNGLIAECNVEIVDHQCFTDTKYKYDENTHWQMSICNLCLDDIEKKNVENHTYINGKCECGKEEPKSTEILPTSISLSKSNAKTCIGANGVDTKLKCSVLTVPTITPENATNKTVTWTSSNNAIVSIENGYIIAKQKGSVVLTAKTVNGLIAECNVEIVDHQCFTDTKYKYDENTHWQMSICNLCLDDIEKKNVENHTFVDGVCKCGKTSPQISEEILGSRSIEVKGKQSYTLEVGDEIDVEAEIISTIENDNVSKCKLVWKSSDSSIVAVKGNNRKAKLTAKNPGSCNIIVSYEDMKSTITVNVTKSNDSVKYDDVKENDWFEESVKYVTNNSLMNGMGDNKFGPADNMTRGMLVTVLYRMSESSYNGKSTFIDVKDNEYYSSAVAWANENNIVNGIGDNKFAPNAEITREQLITILYRYAKAMKIDVSVGENTNILSYNDFNEIAEYSISAFQWGCGEGIISGRTSTTLSPKGTASRAEVATMLMRFMKD